MRLIYAAVLLFVASVVNAQIQLHLSGDGPPSGYCSATRYTDLVSGLTYKCIEATHTWQSNGSTFTVAGTSADATNAANIASGTLPAARLPALSGDVSTSSGSSVTTIGATKVTNAMLAGSIDLTAKVINVLPFALGGNSGSAATSATTGTMTVSMTTAVVSITPTGACTFNASGGVAGETATFVVTTSGVSSFTLTWGTNYKTVGTLATGTTTAKVFTVTFRNTNGTLWAETSRTTAM